MLNVDGNIFTGWMLFITLLHTWHVEPNIDRTSFYIVILCFKVICEPIKHTSSVVFRHFNNSPYIVLLCGKLCIFYFIKFNLNKYQFNLLFKYIQCFISIIILIVIHTRLTSLDCKVLTSLQPKGKLWLHPWYWKLSQSATPFSTSLLSMATLKPVTLCPIQMLKSKVTTIGSPKRNISMLWKKMLLYLC